VVAQYNAAGPGDGIDRLPATMRAICLDLTVRGFINYDFAAHHYAASCARLVPASPMAASIIARLRRWLGTRRRLSSACWRAQLRQLIVRVDGGSKP